LWALLAAVAPPLRHRRSQAKRRTRTGRLHHEELTIPAANLDFTLATGLIEERGQTLARFGVRVDLHERSSITVTPARAAASARLRSRVSSGSRCDRAASNTYAS
jgi:hypothetical protein